MERKVIVITGPTCSGKTTLAIHLAEKLGSEIISADSRQFYKKLDIGTAKPGQEQLSKVKHHFINNLEPDQYFNASIFEKEATEVINSLLEKNIIPIVVGGSGLYIRALIDGIFDSSDADSEVRSRLKEKKEKHGIESLYAELKEVDSVSASRMLPQNWKRVTRALEVFYSTGKPIWQHHSEQISERDFKFSQYGLNWERDTLYRNIENRVDNMIAAGLVEEVRTLLNAQYSKDINALNTVGYKEIISYLKGEISLELAIGLIKRNTRRYAKRQMTWFRHDERIKWFNVSSESDLNIIANEIIKLEGL